MNEIVGIGETGLDYFRSRCRRRCDEACSASVSPRILTLAATPALPVIVHTRARGGRHDRSAALARRRHRRAALLHRVMGRSRETALDLGWYVSISGIVTFRNADNVRDVARRVPADRLLVETDCPWLAPVPQRGKTERTGVRRAHGEVSRDAARTKISKSSAAAHDRELSTACSACDPSGAIELFFVESVVRFDHSHRAIRRLRAGVFPLDVQPQSTTLRGRAAQPRARARAARGRRRAGGASGATYTLWIHQNRPLRQSLHSNVSISAPTAFAVAVFGDEVVAVSRAIEQRNDAGFSVDRDRAACPRSPAPSRG